MGGWAKVFREGDDAVDGRVEAGEEELEEDGEVDEERVGGRSRLRLGKESLGRGGRKVVRCSPRGREMRRSVRMTM